MALTRIHNNQITDATIVASAKLVNNSISANKLAADLTYGSNLTVTGNLTVNGTTTALDSVNTIIEDPVILLAKNETGAPSKDIGFIGERGDANNVAWIFDETDDTFKAGLTTDDGTGTAITLASKVDADFKDLSMVNLAPTGNVTTALNASSTIAAGSSITAVTTITATGNVAGGNLTTGAKVTATGEVKGGSLTDGTATITSGSLTGGVAATFSGAVQGGSITDGTATLSSGSIASGVNGAFSGTVTASTKVSTPDVEGAAITITATGTDDSVTLVPTGAGTIVASSKRITSLATPTGANDAANKSYVDGVASGLDIKASCVAATTAALAAVTYSNGASGVGATLTADANGVLAAIDGVTMVAGERLLVKNQAAQLQNGIYTVTSVGAVGAAFVLTRATDFDAAAEIPGGFTFIEEGTTNADNGFVCTTDATGLTVGTTAIVFEQFSGAGQITAGDGLAKTGDILSVNVDDVTTAISSDAVIVKTSANLTTPNIGVANGDSFTATGTVQGATITDGTATITSGAIASVTTLTTSGNVTTGAGNVIAGNVTGAIGDFSGAVSGSTLTSDSGITISASDIDTAGTVITVNQAGADKDFVIEGSSDANLLKVDAGTNTVIISGATATAGATLKVDSTDSLMLPVGTTAQRPSPATGMFRYNSSLEAVEFYTSGSWKTAGSDFTTIASQTFTGDNSTVAFTLSEAQTTASCIVAINGVVQLPTTAYAVSGTTLTFTEAPIAADVIEVRKLTTTSTITSLANANGTAIVEAIDGAAQVKITGDLLPVSDGNLDLGSAALHWQEAHLGSAIFYDSDDSNTVTLSAPATVGSNVAFTLPAADGTSGQALITDGSGAMSFGAAGATVTSDTATNAERLIYVGSITSGALTAVTQDSGLTYNPSTGTITSAEYIGGGAGLTGLNGSNIASGTVAAARVATLNQNTTGSAATLTTARAIALTGDVTGTANFDGSAGISIAATIAANSVALSTDTTGNYVAAGAVSGTGLSGSAGAEGATFTVTSNATNANTGGTIVARDGSGDFSAGVITATATQARYADLAEMYATDGDIDAGTVVHFAGEGKIASCNEANHHAVAGIISTDPAYLMNTDQAGAALAISGRVPCKVTGAVAAGDLMVSAGNGMAMANNSPAIGTVIGKAIEAHAGGEGTIEILAMMM
tara:strand:- start:7057 stop:10566 length:3510 start_codon:yes stop_codon:yes gene_type:complete